MTLKQLRAFVLAARSLSFTDTAQRLHLTQSAVSLLIRELENAVGIRLFERGRKLELTALGVEFADAVEKILTDLDSTLAGLREAREAQGTVLRIGVGHLLAATVIPHVVADFCARHPAMRVRIVDCPVEQLPQKLLAGEVDLAVGSISGTARMPGLRLEPLFRDSIHLASSRRAPRLQGSQGGGVPWQRLLGEPLILVNAGNRIWAAVSATLARSNAQLRVAHHVGIYSTGIALAREGLGRLLLPGFCASAPELADLAIQPLVGPVIRWDVSVLSRRGAPLDPAARTLVEMLAETAARATAAPEAHLP